MGGEPHVIAKLMSVTFSSLWSRLFAKRETKVLILGLDNAGKVCYVLKSRAQVWVNGERSETELDGEA